MLAHVTLRALSFWHKNNLIIINAGPMRKSNFYDRTQIIYTLCEQVRQGIIKCAKCNGLLKVHGCYRRHVMDGEGKRRDGWIAQGCCVACKKYPTLIPDFIMPYKHYEAAVIEAAISEDEEKCEAGSSESPADESTIQRWVRQFRERGTEAVGRMQSIIYRVQGRHISILKIHNRRLLKQLDYLAQAISSGNTGGVIGRVNAILTRYNSGFL
jgi:hypothetical protein